MNDNCRVESRIHATGTAATATFLEKLIPLSDDANWSAPCSSTFCRARRMRVQNWPRLPHELSTSGVAQIGRSKAAEDLLWTLFNKVDFCVQLLSEDAMNAIRKIRSPASAISASGAKLLGASAPDPAAFLQPRGSGSDGVVAGLKAARVDRDHHHSGDDAE